MKVDLQAFCPLASGMAYPKFPEPAEFAWNNHLEEDLKSFLNRKIFNPILDALPTAFTRLGDGQTLERTQVLVDDFRLEGFATDWVIQEDGFLSTGVHYTYGNITLTIKAKINGVEVAAGIREIMWRPEYSFSYRVDQVVRDLLREYRKNAPAIS